MKEQKAENDALIAYLSNPNAGVVDYLKHNITASNTQLLTREEYKQTPLIKKQFTDKKGVFNEDAFNKLYDDASKKYFELTDEEAFTNFLKYNPTSRYKPLGADVIDTSVELVKGNNPKRLSKSITGLNVLGQQEKTEEELAQMGKIWDSDSKQWKEGTAESQNIWAKVAGKTLVYAQYDKSGIQENPVTGQMEYHTAGEWMTDEDGNYFTMTLSKDDLGNKRVVALSDILTKEDSVINKMDFFDSDGFDKSIGGVAAKTAITILPYLIPGFNAYYGGITAALGLASVMPTFAKALDSTVTGGGDPAAKTLTKLENWFRKFTTDSKSRHGQESFFSIESVGNLLADTFGQLHQQTAVASLAKYFHKLPEADKITSVGDLLKMQKKMNNTQKALSLGYMGLISTADVYNDAIQAGYDNRTAGLTALASAGALFGIMNFNETANGLGTWFLKKSTGYDKEITKAPLIKVAKESYKAAEEAMNKALKGDLSGVNKYFGNFWANAKDKMQDLFIAGNAEGIWKSMIVEGVEEVSEEVVQDTVKGIVDALSAMGFTGSQGSFGGWSNVFSKEGASRYLQTLIGGAIGGAVFDLQQSTIDPWMMRMFKDPNYQSEREKQVDKDIIDVIFEGRTEELLQEVDRLKSIFNTKKGVTRLAGPDGTLEDVVAKGQKTQADAIAEQVKAQIREMDSLIKGKLGVNDFSSISVALQQALKAEYAEAFRTDQLKAFQSEKFKSTLQKMYDAYINWKNYDIRDSAASEQEKQIEGKDSANENNKNKSKEQWRQEYEHYLNKCRQMFGGEESVNTLRQMQLITLEKEGFVNLAKLDKDTWYQIVYKSKPGFGNTKYEDLPQGNDGDPNWVVSKKAVDLAWEAYKASEQLGKSGQSNLVEKVTALDEVYMSLQKAIHEEIGSYVSSKHKKNYIRTKFLDDDVIKQAFEIADEQKDDYDIIANAIATTTGERSGVASKLPTAFSLDDRVKFDIADQLINAGIIDLSDFNERQQKLLKAMINWNAAISGMNIFTEKAVAELIAKTNRQLGDTTNIYKQGIDAVDDAQDENKQKEKTETNQEPSAALDAKNRKVIKFNLGKWKEDFQLTKQDTYKQILGDGDITQEVYRMIVNYASNKILQNISKARIQTAGIDYDQNTKNQIFQTIKNYLLSINVLDGSPTNSADLIMKLDDAVPQAEIFTVQDTITEEIDNLQKQFGQHEILTKHPLRAAIEKIYFSLHGSTEGATIFDWLFEKENQLQQSDFSGDTFQLQEAERRGLQDAITTLKVLNYAIQGMYVGDEISLNDDFKIQPRHINAVQRFFLDTYYDGKGKEDYVVLDESDFNAVADYVGELTYKLETLSKIDSELVKSKSVYYNNLKIQRDAAHRAFYASGVLKSFKMDDDDKPIDLLAGFDPDINMSDTQYCQEAKTIIAKNLREYYNKFTASPGEKRKLFIKKIIRGVANLLESGGFSKESLYEDAIPSWEAIVANKEDDTIAKLNGKYLVKEFIKSLYVDPKDEMSLLADLFADKSMEAISPRIDQEEALINLNFAVQHQNVINELESIFNQLQNEESSEVKENLVSKNLLSNVTFLIGSGGSGKTLLMRLLSKLRSADKKILVAAKEQQKAEDLKKVTEQDGDILNSIFNGLEIWDNTFKSICDSISTWALGNEKGEVVDTSEIKKTSQDSGSITGYYEKDGLKFSFSLYKATEPKNTCWFIDKIYIEKIPSDITTSKLEKDSILIIDECTQLSPLAQAVISKIASDNNVSVIELGDPIQPGWTYNATWKIDKNTSKQAIQYDLSEYQGFVSGNLAGVWRAENDSLQDTISNLYRIYTSVYGTKEKPVFIFNYSKPAKVGNAEYSENIKQRVTDQVPLTYTLSNKVSAYSVLGTIHGTQDLATKAVSTINSIDSQIKISKAVIIPNGYEKDAIKSEITQIYSDIFAKGWEIKTADEAQGAEYDYTLIYGFKPTNNGILERARQAFLCLTRSKRATIIDPSSQIFDNLGFVKSKEDLKIKEYGSEKRDALASARLKELIILRDQLKQIPPINSALSIPEKPEDKGNFVNPVPPATLPDDQKSSTEKTEEEVANEQKKTKDNWVRSFGENCDVAQLEPWYTRLGLTANELKNIQKEEVKKSLVKDFDLTSYAGRTSQDFLGFINILKHHINGNSVDRLSDVIKSVNEGDIDLDTLTIEEALDLFTAVKRRLAENIYAFDRFIILDTEENKKYNLAYQKKNDKVDPKTGAIVYVPMIRGGVFFESADNQKFTITCGTFPTNTIKINGETQIVSKTIANLKPGEIALFRGEIDINSDIFKDHIKGVEKLQTEREDGLSINKSGKLYQLETADQRAIAFPFAQGMIQMRLKGTADFNNASLVTDKNDLKYGRMSIVDYMKLGNEIVRTVDENIENLIEIKDGIVILKGASDSDKKESFKKLIKYYRLMEFKENDSNSEKILSLFRNTWILMKERGSNIPVLVMISKTVPTFKESLSEDNYGSQERLVTYSHYVLLERICKSLDEAGIQCEDTAHNIVKWVDLFNALRSKVEDSSLANTSSAGINVDGVKQLNNFLHNVWTVSNNSNLFDHDQLGNLIHSYIIQVQRSTISKYGPKKIQDDGKQSVDVSKLKPEYQKLYNEKSADSITKTNLDSKIGSLITEIDTKYPNYFYTNGTINLENDKDLQAVKIERVYESAPILWNFALERDYNAPVIDHQSDPVPVQKTVQDYIKEVYEEQKDSLSDEDKAFLENWDGSDVELDKYLSKFGGINRVVKSEIIQNCVLQEIHSKMNDEQANMLNDFTIKINKVWKKYFSEDVNWC